VEGGERDILEKDLEKFVLTCLSELDI